MGFYPRHIRERKDEGGLLGAWLAEHGGKIAAEAEENFGKAQGFMEGVFRRYYQEQNTLEPSREEMYLVDEYLTPVLLPEQRLEPYGEEEYFESLDPTRSDGPLNYTTKGLAWENAPGRARHVYSVLLSEGVLPSTIIGICDKEEILPVEKLDRTRNFAPPPGWLFSCEKAVLGPILDWEVDNHTVLPAKVGMAMHGGVVHEMFEKHQNRTTYELDLSAQEYCYKEWTWSWLCGLRMRASTQPRAVMVLYEAIVNALLHHPDGNIYPPSWANKSGRIATLADNCRQVLLLIFLAYLRVVCADGGRSPDHFWEDLGNYLDIYGDNVILSFDEDFDLKYGIEPFVCAMWEMGFILKVNGRSTSGVGLVWNGMVYGGQSQPLKFAKPEKEVAKLVYDRKSPEVTGQQLLGLHLMCYYTPIEPLLREAARYLETAYGVRVPLFTEEEAWRHWGPRIQQCSNGSEDRLLKPRDTEAYSIVFHFFAERVDKTERCMGNKKKKVKKEVKEVVKVVHEPPKQKKKRKKKAKAKARPQNPHLPTSVGSIVQEGKEKQCAFQILHTDTAVLTPTRLVGPPIPDQSPTKKFGTVTSFLVSTKAWAGNVAGSNRVLILPNGTSHYAFGSAVGGDGSITAWSAFQPADTHDQWAALYESISCTGVTATCKVVTKETNRAGFVATTCYQQVGGGWATIGALTNAQVLSLPKCEAPPDPLHFIKKCLISSDPNNDHGFVGPTAGSGATSGAIIFELVSDAYDNVQTYEITVSATWAAKLLYSNKTSIATSDMIDPAQVQKCILDELSVVPEFSKQRCMEKDDGKAFIGNAFHQAGIGWGGLKSLFGKGSSLRERGEGLYDAVKGFGSMITSIGGLFGTRELVLRQIYALTDEQRRVLLQMLQEEPWLIGRDKLGQEIEYLRWKRRQVITVDPRPACPDDYEEVKRSVEPASPAPSQRARSVGTTRRP